MKIEHINNNQQSFGLKCQTHRFLTAKTVKDADIFSGENLKDFLYYVQKPDFDETGLKIFGKPTCNNHFFYPEQTFRPRLSHLDFYGQNNAFARYMYHIIKMFSSMKKSDIDGQIEHAARAKHFLDDMSVGLHVERGTSLKKYKEQKVHKDFETYIFENQDTFAKNHTSSELQKNHRSFKDLFMDTVQISLKTELPAENNKDRWKNIAQKTVDINMDSSNEFFKLLKHYNLPVIENK